MTIIEIQGVIQKVVDKVKEFLGFGPVKIKFKRLDERAVMPAYAHAGDVCMDLTAIDVEYDSSMDCYIYHTGLAFESGANHGMFMFARSSNRNTESYLCNGVGVVDSYLYRGEVVFCYKNRKSLKDVVESKKFEIMFEKLKTRSKLSLEDIEKAESVEADIIGNPLAYAPYKVGERIGQMLVLGYKTVQMEEVESLSETERGEGGFGSTGK